MPRSACVGEGRDTTADSRRDQEGGGELDSHEKKMDSYLRVRRDQEEGGGAGLRKLDFSFASVVPQQQCYGHCPCDCSAQQLKQQLRNTLVATQ